jgi:hypothetical protein
MIINGHHRSARNKKAVIGSLEKDVLWMEDEEVCRDLPQNPAERFTAATERAEAATSKGQKNAP